MTSHLHLLSRFSVNTVCYRWSLERGLLHTLNGADFRVVLQFTTEFVARWDSVCLAKRCDCIAALSPYQQTHPLKVFAFTSIKL
jgi:hypothetical protein